MKFYEIRKGEGFDMPKRGNSSISAIFMTLRRQVAPFLCFITYHFLLLCGYFFITCAAFENAKLLLNLIKNF
jgi:hypothetical protein